MPRYHFHLIDQRARLEDNEGIEFASLEVAYLDAFNAALEMSFDMLRHRKNPHQYRFEIADGAGVVLLELMFSEVLRPASVGPPLHDDLLMRVRIESHRHRRLVAELEYQLAAVRETLRQTNAVVARSRRTQPLHLG